jgi:MFS family permease
MMPLVAADLTRRSGRFNTAMGLLGFAAGLGATLSTTLAGEIAVAWDTRIAFLALAAAGLVAVLAVTLAMPETRPLHRASNRFGRAHVRAVHPLRWRRRFIRSVMGRNKQKLSQSTFRP